jgi:GntR family transcriptional regulator of arabinose operon
LPPIQEPKALKYWTLVEHLRTQVVQKTLLPGDKAPSLAEMQAQFGMSRATVEKAYDLLEQEGLLVREQGRGTFIRAQASRPQHVIAVSPRLVPNDQNVYWFSLFQGITEEAQEHKVEVIFSSHDYNTIGERADGMIVSHEPISEFGPTPIDFPFVSLISPVPGAYCVSADDRDGLYQLTEHLIGLGHRRIALLYAWLEGSPLVNDRYQGYRDALNAHGIDYDEKCVRIQEPTLRVWHSDTVHVESGYEGMKKWLDSDWKTLGCTAIIAYNDAMAVGAIRALKESGLRIPEDVSITGFDGTPGFEYFTPRLTTIKVPLQEIGRIGLNLLLQILNKEAPTLPRTPLPVSLIKGESTGPCPQTSPQ